MAKAKSRGLGVINMRQVWKVLLKKAVALLSDSEEELLWSLTLLLRKRAACLVWSDSPAERLCTACLCSSAEEWASSNMFSGFLPFLALWTTPLFLLHHLLLRVPLCHHAVGRDLRLACLSCCNLLQCGPGDALVFRSCDGKEVGPVLEEPSP
ncbi:hypothetical protein MHYP_G00062720 [Metynnis hypsauchen]